VLVISIQAAAGAGCPRTAGHEHDIVQFLGAGQHGDQDFCLRRTSAGAPPHRAPHPAAMLSSSAPTSPAVTT
jgi:hypothetical protein